MNKLIFSVCAAAALAAGGAALAQDAGSQAGSAWRNNPLTPQLPPNPHATEDDARYGPAYGTPEYYGNSGWTPPPRYGYVYRGTDRWGRPLYSQVVPAAPYVLHDRASRRDRDGDGVRNRRDRHPDDYRRW